MNDNAHAFASIVQRLPQKGVTETNHSSRPHLPGLAYKHS